MFEPADYTGTREENYQLLLEQLVALVSSETSLTANLANASALLFQFLREVNWVGFYLHADGTLILGPFQGLPACTRIPLGKGVCGDAAKNREIVRVDDVTCYPGHITCDAASRSELVIPLLQGQRLLGVLDIDSPQPARFDELDTRYLNQFCQLLLQHGIGESFRPIGQT